MLPVQFNFKYISGGKSANIVYIYYSPAGVEFKNNKEVHAAYVECLFSWHTENVGNSGNYDSVKSNIRWGIILFAVRLNEFESATEQEFQFRDLQRFLLHLIKLDVS